MEILGKNLAVRGNSRCKGLGVTRMAGAWREWEVGLEEAAADPAEWEAIVFTWGHAEK